jgi:hypothetical protein
MEKTEEERIWEAEISEKLWQVDDTCKCGKKEDYTEQ